MRWVHLTFCGAAGRVTAFRRRLDAADNMELNKTLVTSNSNDGVMLQTLTTLQKTTKGEITER